MFDRYTEKARRVIFFARREAGACGSASIETRHLRAGLFHEAPEMFERFALPYQAPPKEGSPLPSSLDLPLSPASQRALAYAAEESKQMGSATIGPGHLLMGILKEEGAEVYKIRCVLLASWPDVSKAAPALVEILGDFSSRIAAAKRKLLSFTDESASQPLREGGWSRKQLLGHLIDSAANNHQRFVRAQMEDALVSPGYAQESWVETQQYQRVSWNQLVEFWVSYNRHLVHVASCIPAEKLGRLVRVGGDEPAPLELVITGYIAHCEHHLEQLGV